MVSKKIIFKFLMTITLSFVNLFLLRLLLVVKTTHEKNHRRIFGGQNFTFVTTRCFIFTGVCLFPVAKENLIVSCCLLNVMQKSQT